MKELNAFLIEIKSLKQVLYNNIQNSILTLNKEILIYPYNIIIKDIK